MFNTYQTEESNNYVSVVRQFRAIRQYPITGVWGAILGGFPPQSTFLLAHYVMPAFPQSPDLKYLVYGGLLVSSTTIAKAMYRMVDGGKAFRVLQALGFTVILEGIMAFSPDVRLAWVAVIISVLVNALEKGYTMVERHKACEASDASTVEQIRLERQEAIDSACAMREASIRAEYKAASDARKAKRAASQAKVSAEAKPAKRRKTTAQRKSAETGSPVLVQATNLLETPEGAEKIVAESIEVAA